MSDHTMTTVRVDYKEQDGWHVFSSDQIYGLYVASKELETAFEDVGPTIEKLIKLNYNLDVKVHPVPPFEEFLDLLGSREPSVRPEVAAAAMRDFAIYAS